MRYAVLPLSTVKRFEALAAKRGVSEVARSSRGFLTAYKRAGSFNALPLEWRQRRDAFIARHMAQMQGEALFKPDGTPSRRHLALIMWAYSPTPSKLRGREVRKNPRDVMDNEAFRRWFGESKVVDEEGRPLVVYHGTNRGGFVEFDLGEIDEHHNGFFFASDPRLALTYTKARSPSESLPAPALRTVDDVLALAGDEDFIDVEEGFYVLTEDGRTSRLYDSTRSLLQDWELEDEADEIKTGYFVNIGESRHELLPEDDDVERTLSDIQADVDYVKRPGVYAVYLRILDPLVVDARGANWDSIAWGEDEDGAPYRVTTNEITMEAQDAGHDGVIIENVYDSGAHGYGSESGDVYVVFDPHQIKSATVNTGEFSTERESIRNPGSGLRDALGVPRDNPGDDSFSALDVFGFVDAEDPAPLNETREALRNAKRGDVVSVGKSKWVVFRVLGDMQLWVFKHPSKYRKTYEIQLAGLEGAHEEVVVFETGGSGQRASPDLYRGPLRLTGERVDLR